MERWSGSLANRLVMTANRGVMSYWAIYPTVMCMRRTIRAKVSLQNAVVMEQYGTSISKALIRVWCRISLIVLPFLFLQIVSYNVPPYGRSGLYLELANLRELLDEYRSSSASGGDNPELRQSIYAMTDRSGMIKDVPLLTETKSGGRADSELDILESISNDVFDSWAAELSVYLNVLQDRLFSSGLHVLGGDLPDEDILSYLEAYYGERLPGEKQCEALSLWHQEQERRAHDDQKSGILRFIENVASHWQGAEDEEVEEGDKDDLLHEATSIVSLLKRSHEELGSVMKALDGGYVLPKPGGDLLRDGPSVLPTGRNTHAVSQSAILCRFFHKLFVCTWCSSSLSVCFSSILTECHLSEPGPEGRMQPTKSFDNIVRQMMVTTRKQLLLPCGVWTPSRRVESRLQLRWL